MSGLLITTGDILCVLGFSAALVLVLMIRTEDPLFPSSVKTALAIAMGLYVFVGMSNVLEWLGVTGFLDVYEDYAEMLFLPVTAYAVYMLSMARQVDAALKAETAIRSEHDLLTAIVDTTPTGIVVATRSGEITFANDPARSLVGIEESGSGALMVRDGVRLGGQRTDWTDMREALADMTDGPPLRDAIRFVMHPEGETVSVSVSTNRLGGAEGDRTVVAFTDISERMRYRQDLERTVSERTAELVELNSRLEEANSAKREFLAKMSHELRTPLNSVIGFTGILMDGMAGPLKDEQLKQLSMVRRSGRQLLDIVNDVLDITRIESGKAAVTSESVDLPTFTRQLVELMKPYCDDRSIELRAECPDDAGSIRTDPGKLGQVLRNLISNAVKFTDPSGHVVLSVRVDDGTATFEVMDNGIGIGRSHLEDIFEPFSQIDTPERMRPQGAGLGLAVSRDLISLLGGRIRVESEVGKGSTFTVTLPVSPS